jgi:hypothetical protein
MSTRGVRRRDGPGHNGQRRPDADGRRLQVLRSRRALDLAHAFAWRSRWPVARIDRVSVAGASLVLLIADAAATLPAARRAAPTGPSIALRSE